MMGVVLGAVLALLLVARFPVGGNSRGMQRHGHTFRSKRIARWWFRVSKPITTKNQQQRLMQQLPVLCSVLELGARGGANVLQCVMFVGDADIPLWSSVFKQAGAASHRDQTLTEALYTLDHHTKGVANRIVVVLINALQDGSGLAKNLEVISNEIAQQMRRRAEARARKAPVFMLIPLTLFLLPAFALLTVVPIAIGQLHDLRVLFAP